MSDVLSSVAPISLNVPLLSDDETATLGLLLTQLEAKSRRNRLRSSYYDGRRVIKQVGTVIPPSYRKLGLALGWAAKGVDGLARRCNIDQFVWAEGDLDALGIDALTDSNFLHSELAQARTDSLIHGVSYLITTAGEDGEPAALVQARDALNTTGEWNIRRRALDNLLSVTNWTDGQVTGFVLYLDNLIINATKENGRWEIDRQEHGFGVPAEALVYRPRASRRMGRSRINRPVMSIQDSALRALIRMEAHMDIYAIPKLMLLGAPDEIFRNADGSQKVSWQMAMGRAFAIPDNTDAEQANQRASVQQFDASSPAPHLSQLNSLAKLMARETDLPDSDFALTDMANPTSADAYNASRENLIAEAEGAMDDWSIAIRRTVSRALAIQNDLAAVPADWAGIEPKWRSPVYLSRAAAADAGAKQLAAVPWLAETDVGLELLGLDAQQIERALAQKRRLAGRDVIAALTAPKPTTNAVSA